MPLTWLISPPKADYIRTNCCGIVGTSYIVIQSGEIVSCKRIWVLVAEGRVVPLWLGSWVILWPCRNHKFGHALPRASITDDQ